MCFIIQTVSNFRQANNFDYLPNLYACECLCASIAALYMCRHNLVYSLHDALVNLYGNIPRFIFYNSPPP